MDSRESPIRQWQAIAWAALDELRSSPVESGGWLHTLIIFFLKFVSDLALDREDGAAFEEWPSSWKALSISPEFQWKELSHHIGRSSFSRTLDRAVRSLEAANDGILDGLARDVRFEKFERYSLRGAEILSAVFEKVSRADLRPSHTGEYEVFGDFMDWLLLLRAEREGRFGGEFHVPQELADLLAGILAPCPGQLILDPFCGSGTLLSRLARYAGVSQVRCAGQSPSPESQSLCRINLAFRGVGDPKIHVSDALRDPLTVDAGQLLRADVVVSNPPFGWRNWGGEELLARRPELFRYGLNPRGGSEYAFLAHMLEAAEEGRGRIGTLVSLGALFRQEDKAIRRCLVEENLLVAAVSLPANLFHGTGIGVAALILDKLKSTDEILFVDASKTFISAGGVNRIPSEEVQRIVEIFCHRRDVPGFSRWVSRAEVQTHDFNLIVPLYVKGKSVESFETDAQLLHEIKEIEGELVQVQGEVDVLLGALGLPIE